MKKILENLYVFSKLSTTLVLFIALMVMGYFFYKSYQKQDELFISQIKEENLINEKIDNNYQQIKDIVTQIQSTSNSIKNIEKILQDSPNNSKSVIEFENLFQEVNNNFQKLSFEIKNIKKQINNNYKTQTDDFLLNNNESKDELIQLILIKYKNNINYLEDLNYLETIVDKNKTYIIDKIRLLGEKPFKGEEFLIKKFKEEINDHMKMKFKKTKNKLFKTVIIPYVSIEPSSVNAIQDSELIIIKKIIDLINNKKFDESLENIQLVKNYSDYYKETIEQLTIITEFKKQIKELS